MPVESPLLTLSHCSKTCQWMNTYTPLKEWASKTSSLQTSEVQTLSHILFHVATQKLENSSTKEHYIHGKLVFKQENTCQIYTFKNTGITWNQSKLGTMHIRMSKVHMISYHIQNVPHQNLLPTTQFLSPNLNNTIDFDFYVVYFSSYIFYHF